MYRDFGENITFKHVEAVAENISDKAIVRLSFTTVEQGEAVVKTLRDAADRMEKELAAWRQAEAEGKWL
jgi:hypothetical protein